MNNKSWRVDSYQEGKYKVSVRKNLENDRIDEGDIPENGFEKNENQSRKYEE